MDFPTITVNARAYDGTLRKTWTAELLARDEKLLTAKGIFDTEIEHAHLDVIRPGTISYEYFWLDRWYNVFRFHESDGVFRNYYCNICMPPIVSRSVLEYIDLDIDIIVDAWGEMTIVDEHEFRENAERFGYGDEIHTKAADALAEVTRLIRGRAFPFDQAESLQL